MMDRSSLSPTNRPPAISVASLRTVVAVIFIFVAIWIGMSVAHYYSSKSQIRALLYRQANDMATTLAMADQYMQQMLDQLHTEQNEHLLDIGAWLIDLDRQSPLTPETIEYMAENTSVFNIVVFDNRGQREFGLRGQGGLGRQRRFRTVEPAQTPHSPGMISEFLESGKPYQVQGLVRGGNIGQYRYSVLLRRPGGGALAINADANRQERIRREMGPEALLQAFAGRGDVLYVEQRFGGFPPFRLGLSDGQPPDEVLEILVPIPGEVDHELLVGFDSAPLRNAESELRYRLAISIGIALLLCVTGLLWTRFEKHQDFLERALQKVQSYHRVVLEQMDDAVIAFSDPFIARFWNPRAEQLFPSLKSIQQGQPLPPPIRDLAQTGDESAIVALADSTETVQRYRMVREQIDEPIPTRLLFFTNVTLIEQAAKDQQQKQHLEALAKIASGVAHEVRNPLNAIDMTIQTLCMEPSGLGNDELRTLRELRSEIARINQIVEHFLSYGRPKPPEFAEIDLASVVAEAVRFLEPSVADIPIELVVDADAPALTMGDAQQLRQVMLNIVLNAIDASEPGSHITLRVRNEEERVWVECADQGIGMTAEQVASIFDPYVSGKVNGIGLGMSIVKRILDDHGAQIAIQSSPGQGATVRIAFRPCPTAIQNFTDI